MADNFANKSKEELKLAIIQAYYTEYFARHKKMPRLNKVLKDIEKPTKTISKGDMLLMAMANESKIK